MKRDQYWSKPKKASVLRGMAEAWWYADRGSIQLHVQPINSQDHIEIRLPRAVVAKYLARSS